MDTDNKQCRLCGGRMKRYDSVKRIIRYEYGKTDKIMVERFYCEKCRHITRDLPEFLLPYKHYRKDIIVGFVSNNLSGYELTFEDYPSESTVIRWKKQYIFPPPLI